MTVCTQLFQVQEDIKSVSKRRQSLMAQLARHKGRLELRAGS